MVQTVVPFTVQLVKFETTLPFKEVVSRLETQLNKAGCDNILARIRAAKDKHELRSLIENTMGESGFLYVDETHCYSHALQSNQFLVSGSACRHLGGSLKLPFIN